MGLVQLVVEARHEAVAGQQGHFPIGESYRRDSPVEMIGRQVAGAGVMRLVDVIVAVKQAEIRRRHQTPHSSKRCGRR